MTEEEVGIVHGKETRKWWDETVRSISGPREDGVPEGVR